MNYHRLHKPHEQIKNDLIGKTIRCHVEEIDTKNEIMTISNRTRNNLVLIQDAFYEVDQYGEYIELEVKWGDVIYECVLLDTEFIKDLCNQ